MQERETGFSPPSDPWRSERVEVGSVVDAAPPHDTASEPGRAEPPPGTWKWELGTDLFAATIWWLLE